MRHARHEIAAMLPAPKGRHAKKKIKNTMEEFKAGTLHSGSSRGPTVTSHRQAIAIALNQARRRA